MRLGWLPWSACGWLFSPSSPSDGAQYAPCETKVKRASWRRRRASQRLQQPDWQLKTAKCQDCQNKGRWFRLVVIKSVYLCRQARICLLIR
ncbi:hypothetical protein BD289DRAFT_424152 [Coniella lustricola]|uniref:Secreted protein n=1 Tax=Coniella lustricola TaxID=2025994 RepID=A0A2T3AJ04_9PEZI|nr:hypothetical protein BD289DRAFT_424152 [Coniella lustricola]